MMRMITAMFDSRSQADQAVQRLTQELNIDRDLVQVYAAETTSTTAAPASGTQDAGLWATLKDLFVPDEDRYAYAEGMRRGSTVVSAQVEEGMLDDAMSILENQGAVDLDSREAEWRQSGWTGYQAGAAADTTVASSPSTTGLGVAATGVAAQTGLENRTATTGSATQVGGEQVIPIVEEQIRVGKRDVERGRVRVRSYMVETPVSEQVSLREERVEVQRRAVDRPLTDADDAFREQTIEATEHREEAIVSKEARVVEEVSIRKDTGEHVETVHDTVRRQEVEIDDTTGARTAGSAGAAGAGNSNPPGTVASRAVDDALGTNISGANPTRKD
ncbi:YsnF/AvaK domain-containing protein [Pseudoroseomonas ludipueritiae]|uniref:YsnF/AvaK domain-containing protein n=1 Tax=Pseudoroseomonas ludipueritiae TaxID=198093 RepID=A0ABR7R376_9PROT|nr:YsnF/AvaK domain-containing protein [Pseudoroseomonas ludipueritiae]MBC9176176.1 YsnF/AvaK domain-containing protein [Pseudoroseomonas ludipueritiae]